MEFLGIVKFGSLRIGNNVVPVPSKPYNTDSEIYLGSGLGDLYDANDNIKVSNSDNNNLLTWYKFNSEGKVIYVCDRVIINNLSENQLRELLYTDRYIDNNKYRIRCLNKNEWINSVELGLSIGLPINNIDEFSGVNKNVQDNYHNAFWNWIGIKNYIINEDIIIAKGCNYPNAEYVSLFNCGDYGFRPVLEEFLPTPIVNCEEGRLGEVSEPFDFKYTVTSYLDNDVLTIKEKFNGEVVNNYVSNSGVVDSVMSLSNVWNENSYGVQKIEIEAINKNNEVSNKVATFTVSTPTFVDKNGLTYFANQLWTSKIKPFVEEFSKKQGGLVLDSGFNYEGVGTKYNTAYVDNGVGIRHGVTSTASTIAKFNTSDLKLGRHGVVVRASLSDGSLTSNVFTVNIYKKASDGSRTSIGSRTFKANEFIGGNNSYKCAYFSFDYAIVKNLGDTVDIEVVSVSGANSNTLILDYILISPLLPAVYS